jgi:hypothetical protein
MRNFGHDNLSGGQYWKQGLPNTKQELSTHSAVSFCEFLWGSSCHSADTPVPQGRAGGMLDSAFHVNNCSNNSTAPILFMLSLRLFYLRNAAAAVFLKLFHIFTKYIFNVFSFKIERALSHFCT